MEAFGVINYVTYFIGALFVILGPNSLYVLALSAQQGRRVGWAAVAAVLIGDSLLILATALGAVTILTTYPAIFMFIKYAGAGYLIYIGYNLITGAITSWRQLDDKNLQSAVKIKKTTGIQAFRKALLVSLLNPKAILFFLSFFAQAVLIYAGSTLAESFRKRKKVSAISGGSVGIGFVGFAVKLALASAT